MPSRPRARVPDCHLWFPILFFVVLKEDKKKKKRWGGMGDWTPRRLPWLLAGWMGRWKESQPPAHGPVGVYAFSSVFMRKTLVP